MLQDKLWLPVAGREIDTACVWQDRLGGGRKLGVGFAGASAEQHITLHVRTGIGQWMRILFLHSISRFFGCFSYISVER